MCYSVYCRLFTLSSSHQPSSFHPPLPTLLLLPHCGEIRVNFTKVFSLVASSSSRSCGVVCCSVCCNMCCSVSCSVCCSVCCRLFTLRLLPKQLVWCTVLQCVVVATHCNTLQHMMTLQHTATHHDTATHCNTL